MRKVIVDGMPPQHWIDEAEKVTQRLRDAVGPEARKTIINENEGLWRDDRIRNWLLGQFHNKCWYTEAQDSVSSFHVDHFRPKIRALDLYGNACEGYWWLAFEWTNYRISGQLLNVKKRDLFPIAEGPRATCNEPASLHLEAPLLIDPRTEQASLISYEKDEDGCISIPAAGIDSDDHYLAEKTIEILGLNRLDRLNKKRALFWDQCIQEILNYQSASNSGAQALKRIHQAKAISQLREMVKYEKEFSSVMIACIKKNASEALQTSVFY